MSDEPINNCSREEGTGVLLGSEKEGFVLFPYENGNGICIFTVFRFQ